MRTHEIYVEDIPAMIRSLAENMRVSGEALALIAHHGAINDYAEHLRGEGYRLALEVANGLSRILVDRRLDS